MMRYRRFTQKLSTTSPAGLSGTSDGYSVGGKCRSSSAGSQRGTDGRSEGGAATRTSRSKSDDMAVKALTDEEWDAFEHVLVGDT